VAKPQHTRDLRHMFPPSANNCHTAPRHGNYGQTREVPLETRREKSGKEQTQASTSSCLVVMEKPLDVAAIGEQGDRSIECPALDTAPGAEPVLGKKRYATARTPGAVGKTKQGNTSITQPARSARVGDARQSGPRKTCRATEHQQPPFLLRFGRQRCPAEKASPRKHHGEGQLDQTSKTRSDGFL
jgi:hypothetical protein